MPSSLVARVAIWLAAWIAVPVFAGAVAHMVARWFMLGWNL